jgi:recombination protein RecT
MTASTKVETFNPNKAAASPVEIRRFLEANLGAIRRVATSAMNPTRMVAIVGVAVSRSPMLVKCTPMSLLRSTAEGAQLGLEVAGVLQEFHLVPYWNTDLGCYEAQGIPGYPGLVKLVLEGGKVARVTAHVVYEGDVFDIAYGDKPFLSHKPSLENMDEAMPDSKIRGFYAVAFYADGGSVFEVMGKGAVNKLRDRAQDKKKNKDSGPWVTDYAEMGIKTALRKLCKRLPKTPALARALELQAQAESGDFTAPDILGQVPITGAVIDGETVPGDVATHGSVAGAAQPSGKPDYSMGGGLSEKQLAAARAAASRLSVDAAGAEAVLCVISNRPKPEPKAFMDVIFSRDDQKITAVFLTHPAFQAALDPGTTDGSEPPPPPPGDPEPPHGSE